MAKKFSSIVGSDGRVTLPRAIKERLGLAKGDRVEFVLEEKSTVIRPLRTGENPFEAYVGALGGVFSSVKEINAWIADMRGDGDTDKT
jgi:AbrB family looped-hinge helix DNA binding protein